MTMHHDQIEALAPVAEDQALSLSADEVFNDFVGRLVGDAGSGGQPADDPRHTARLPLALPFVERVLALVNAACNGDDMLRVTQDRNRLYFGMAIPLIDKAAQLLEDATADNELCRSARKLEALLRVMDVPITDEDPDKVVDQAGWLLVLTEEIAVAFYKQLVATAPKSARVGLQLTTASDFA